MVKQSTWKTKIFVFKLSPSRSMIAIVEWGLGTITPIRGTTRGTRFCLGRTENHNQQVT